jgi:hypothetical protein
MAGADFSRLSRRPRIGQGLGDAATAGEDVEVAEDPSLEGGCFALIAAWAEYVDIRYAWMTSLPPPPPSLSKYPVFFML